MPADSCPWHKCNMPRRLRAIASDSSVAALVDLSTPEASLLYVICRTRHRRGIPWHSSRQGHASVVYRGEQIPARRHVFLVLFPEPSFPWPGQPQRKTRNDINRINLSMLQPVEKPSGFFGVNQRFGGLCAAIEGTTPSGNYCGWTRSCTTQGSLE